MTAVVDRRPALPASFGLALRVEWRSCVWAIEADLAPAPDATSEVPIADVEGHVALLISQLDGGWLCLINERLVTVNEAALFVVERGGPDLANVAEVMPT